MATFRDRFAETITEEDIERTRRDRLAHLAQERARMEMANRLGIDPSILELCKIRLTIKSKVKCQINLN